MQGSRVARAFDDLYRRHVREVYRYAYVTLGNNADAEDVTQTTFMNALRALERGERPRKPSGWLLAIAHNVVRERFRQSQSRPVELELSPEVAGVERDDASGPTVSEILTALGRIPHLQREAIVLREFEGRAYAEIARILGVTTSAVETLLFRARRSLVDELEGPLTCEQTELAISRRLGERLSRKERRRLDEHLRECPTCARFDQVYQRGTRSFKGLAVLPVPASLTLLEGVRSAAAAAGLPAIGVAGGSGGGTAVGAFAGGGIAVKAAVGVAALGVASGAAYTGVQEVRDSPAAPPAKSARVTVETRRAELVGLGAAGPTTAEARPTADKPGSSRSLETRAPRHDTAHKQAVGRGERRIRPKPASATVDAARARHDKLRRALPPAARRKVLRAETRGATARHEITSTKTHTAPTKARGRERTIVSGWRQRSPTQRGSRSTVLERPPTAANEAVSGEPPGKP